MEYRKVQRGDDTRKVIVEQDDSIVVPQIRYRRVGYVAGTDKFDGDVVPVPMVLIEYLKELELRVFSLIMNYQRKGKTCIMRYKTMAVIFGCTITSVANAIRSLRDMGLITLSANALRKDKSVNLQPIQFLSDLSKDLRPGALAALRRVAGMKDIMTLPKSLTDEIRKRFDASDPVEFEEYD